MPVSSPQQQKEFTEMGEQMNKYFKKSPRRGTAVRYMCMYMYSVYTCTCVYTCTVYIHVYVHKCMPLSTVHVHVHVYELVKHLSAQHAGCCWFESCSRQLVFFPEKKRRCLQVYIALCL